MVAEVDLLTINRGMVTAPAGCGKTHQIAVALSKHAGESPILVLTHTNAGVAALRRHLSEMGVPPKAYRLSTLDGLALRLIRWFPATSGHDPDILLLENPGSDYRAIRTAALGLVRSGSIWDSLTATYSRVIVDEYQDCSQAQHAIIAALVEHLPTCVLGDHLQAIFNFDRQDPLPHWDNDVCSVFPVVHELDVPWRWNRVGMTELGAWLMDVRVKLLKGDCIDLTSAPDMVEWVELSDTGKTVEQSKAMRVRSLSKGERVLVIGDSRNATSRHRAAARSRGISVVEPVDLRDLVEFSRSFDPFANSALRDVFRFAQSHATGVRPKEVQARLRSLERGTARKAATDLEQAVLDFLEAPSFQAAGLLFSKLMDCTGIRVFRHISFLACINALRSCGEDSQEGFRASVLQVREGGRYSARPLPSRAIGSTLLLKGLEAEHCVILDAEELDTKNLYVALTRGAKSITICSHRSTLNSR